MQFPLSNIFFVFIMIMIYGISFVLSYVFYAYMINKKEKKFILTAYSKWSILITNTLNFSFPLLIIMDHFKNNFMKAVNVAIKDIIYYFILLCVICFFNNILIKHIYQTKFIKKLSDKMKKVCKSFNP
jgi:hypothetical protein